MPELRTVYGKYESQGLVLIGIHSDPDIQQRDSIVSSMDLPYPICEDTFAAKKRVTGSLYKVDHYPTVVVINRSGEVSAIDPPDLDAAVRAELAKK